MDEHSANVERLAAEHGTEPRALVDEWAADWRAAFDRFDISYDRFIRTTDADHARASVEMVRRAQAAGDIYKGTYAGWYCPGDNEFKTDSQIVDGRCPDHPTLELQWLEEENYFFALSAYQGALEELYATNPSFCEPEHFRNEVLGWLKRGAAGLQRQPRRRLVGHPGPRRPGAPHLRLVRRADQLPHRRRLPGRRRARSSAAGRPTSTSSARTSPASTASTGRRC